MRDWNYRCVICGEGDDNGYNHDKINEVSKYFENKGKKIQIFSDSCNCVCYSCYDEYDNRFDKIKNLKDKCNNMKKKRNKLERKYEALKTKILKEYDSGFSSDSSDYSGFDSDESSYSFDSQK